MPTFGPADTDDQLFLESVRDEFEPDLTTCQVRIKLLFAYPDRLESGEIKGPPLKLHGVPCAAIVSINSLKLRSQGLADATVIVDYSQWVDANEPRRRALIHHELHHLKPKTYPNGIPYLDKFDRPILKMRMHDFQVGWFSIIAEIHGDNSYEVRQARTLTNESGQMVFPWVKVDSEKPSREEPSDSDDIIPETIEMSTRSETVTLSSKDFEKLDKAVKKLRSRNGA
jgi:hypothetical protein